MARMRGRHRNGACDCLDCGDGAPISKAQEKREWRAEVEKELDEMKFYPAPKSAALHCQIGGCLFGNFASPRCEC